MQFKVPQFIDIESKIIGSLTFKQAIYVGGGLGVSFLLFKFLHPVFAFPLIIAVGSFAFALAFYPKDKLGKPFIEITESAFKYMTKAKLYTWEREEKKPKPDEKTAPTAPVLPIPKVSKDGLQNISKTIETRSVE